MTNKEKQKEEERKVFEEFEKVCPLKIQSFTSQEEPKPDIICTLSDGKKVEFELVEAMDREFRHRQRLSLHTHVGMLDHHKKIPKSLKEKFDRLYDNAIIRPDFHEKCNTESKRQKAYPVIFEYLLKLDRNFAGDIVPKTPALRNICRKITIDRVNFQGPDFYECVSGNVCEGVYERILDKFNNKSYEPTYQLNLLVHANSSAKDIWMKDVQKYVEGNSANSQFERVWVFNSYIKKIEYVFPRLI